MKKLLLLVVVVVCIVFTDANAAGFSCDTGTLSDTCTVTSLKTIDANDIVSGSGSLVIGSGGELRVATSSYFSIEMGGDITIQSGGKISGNLLGATSTNFTIDIGGMIDVSGKGYIGGTTGAGTTCSGCGGQGASGSYAGSYYGGGGSYGGSGGTFSPYNSDMIITPAGISYGSTTAPLHFGSGGGGGGASAPGGNGGGAVKLIISGTLTNNGLIKADGSNGVYAASHYAGGGSGGSIFISTNILSGNGSTTSNGGNGGRANGTSIAGGGGGGRIAVYFDTNNSTISYSALGKGVTIIESAYGGAGTIFTKARSVAYGDLLLNNGGYRNSSSTLSSFTNFSLSSTTITGGALLHIPDNVTLNVSGSLSLSNLAGIIVHGASSVLTANSFTVVSGSTTLDVNKDITIPPNFTTVTINGNSTISHSTSTFPTAHLFSLIMSANNLTINSGGAIDATGKGFLGGTTTAGFSCVGCGGGGGSGYSGGVYYGGGGSYGGKGSNFDPYVSGIIVTANGSPYGSTTAPTHLGSGGGGGGSSTQGGNGGGAIKLIVSGTLTNNGWIMANGTSGAYNANQFAGGGSGGSVWIQTDLLAGSGTVTANGGNGGRHNGTNFAGGGGGGRIASFYTTDNSTIIFSAFGKGVTTIQNTYGGAGTIYKKSSANSFGDLTLNNGGYQNASTTISSTSNISFASTTITGGAILHIPNSVTVNAGSSLTVSNLGSLVLAGTGTIFSTDSLNIQTGSSTIDVNKDIVSVPSFGNVTINSGSTLTHSTSTFPTAHYYSLIMSANNLTINSGGAIDVTGKGFLGATTTAGFSCVGCNGGGAYLSASTGGGGGHGGAGGSGLNTATPVAGGASYGSDTSPVTLGSGGGGSGDVSYVAGNGGGAIKLIVSGALVNNGSILAGGGVGRGISSTRKAGGGAGGSIWITTGSLSCSGVVSANGGNGFYFNTTNYGGGGAGGRIKLSYGSGSTCSTLTATAGVANGSYGLASDGSALTVTSPTITTTPASSVTVSGATLNGTISAIGGANVTNRGFAYGVTTTYGSTSTDPGTHSTGAFSTTTYNLSPNTTYHFRAYAINSVGTAFGSDQQFVTNIDVPTVSTDAISSISMTGATLNGTIGDLGGDSVIDRGFAYGPTGEYTATSSELGTFSIGSFTYDLSNLTCATTYHIRAYASNSTETGYGTDQTFTTNACPIPVIAQVQTNTGGGTVQSRIANLMRLGLYQSAEELQNKWAHVLVPNTNILPNSLTALPFFMRELDFGDIGSDVRRLQEFLGRDKDVYPDGRVTGYFGILTKQAITAYQLKNKIINSPKGRGSGRMGPKTKEFINSILGRNS